MPNELSQKEKASAFLKEIQSQLFLPEQQSNEAVDLLRIVSENATFLSGTTYGIDEKFIAKINQFLNRITD